MENYTKQREINELVTICLYLYSSHLVADVILVIINLYNQVEYSLYYAILTNTKQFLKNKLLCITYNDDINKLEIIQYLNYHYKNLYIFTKHINITYQLFYKPPTQIKVIIISTTSIHSILEYYPKTNNNIITYDEFTKLCSKETKYEFDSYCFNNYNYITYKDCNKLINEKINRIHNLYIKNFIT